jgi:LCP family protein required for cell wall assembly
VRIVSEHGEKEKAPGERIGRRLKQAREEQGLTLEQAQQRSNILGDCLEALEREDFDALPNPLWARGLTITYADSLGLEGMALAETFFPAPRPWHRKGYRGRHLRRRLTVLITRHWRALAVVLGIMTVAAVAVATILTPYNNITNSVNSFLHRVAPDTFLGSGPQRVVVLASVKVGTPGGGDVMAVKVSQDDLGVLAIPDDTLVEIPGHGAGDIGNTLTLEGPDLTRRAVTRLTGVETPYYLVIDAEGIKEVVSKIGGVRVAVPHRISGRASIGGAQLTLQPGLQKLNSDEILVYLQGEDLPSSAERAKRQQAFLYSMFGQAFSVENLLSNPTTLNALLDHSQSNISGLEAIQFASRLRGLKNSGASVHAQVIPGQEEVADSRQGYSTGDHWVPDAAKLRDALRGTFR